MKAARVPLILSLTIASLLVGGGASAAWISSAAGSAGARSLDGEAVVVAESTAPATLYPGADAGTIVVVVTNPNPYPVEVTAIDAGEATSITAEDAAQQALAACTAAHSISYSWTTLGGLGHVVAPDGGTFTYTLTGALAMSNASHADCAGAVFTVPVGITAVSAAGAAPTSPTNATVAVP